MRQYMRWIAFVSQEYQAGEDPLKWVDSRSGCLLPNNIGDSRWLRSR